MSVSVSAPDQQPRVAQHTFAFVMNRRPLIQGTIGAVVILGLGFSWSWLTGRITHVDATSCAILIASITLVPAFMLHRLIRGTRQAAATLGHIELDDSGARWLRPDGTFGFNVSWSDVDHATFDQRNSTAVLFQRGGGAGVILGALGQYGTPSGAVVLERFDQLVAVVSTKVPTSDHRAGTTRSLAKESASVQLAARRTLLLGALCCVTAAAVYAANLVLRAHLDWNRWLVPMPLVIGGMGVLAVVAGIRVRAGSGPQVSPLYSPTYRATMIRFLVVATIANFVLIGVVNVLAR